MRIYRTIEFFKEYARNKKGKCLSEEFKNSNGILMFECEFGHQWETKSVNITYSNSWCPYCNKNTKDNLNTFKEIAFKRSGECLSEEYINSKHKLTFKCKLGHVWDAIPENIKNNKAWCPICGDSLPLTIEEMKTLAIERGGECLSEKYINNHTDLIWKCDKGHTWSAVPNRIKSAKTWCPECNGDKKKTIEEMGIIAKSRNGKCLSLEYVGVHEKLLWECENKHQWEASCHSVLKNNWCSKCKSSNGEKAIRFYLERNNIEYIFQKGYEDCKNKYMLRFDFYLPNSNILIEFDGKQHYAPINHFGGNKSFEETQMNDKIKNKYCEENNIKLIRIPFYEKRRINSILEFELNQ